MTERIRRQVNRSARPDEGSRCDVTAFNSGCPRDRFSKLEAPVSNIAAVLSWYLAIQLCALAALPLALRYFRALPDRGYAFAKVLGPFLVGVILWLGASYGLLRNELGGAWIASGVVALVSYAFGGHRLLREGVDGMQRTRLTYVAVVEVLFAAAYIAWVWVRAHDPAANHTEQPMDLMFMNSIWSSPTFPPRDAWLAGYPISYYYLGYWLLTTLGHIASVPPALAFNVGQAAWYGLLLTSSFGLGYNLNVLEARGQRDKGQKAAAAGSGSPVLPSYVAGLLTASFVGVIGNLQVVLEWLYAQGRESGADFRLAGRERVSRERPRDRELVHWKRLVVVAQQPRALRPGPVGQPYRGHRRVPNVQLHLGR